MSTAHPMRRLAGCPDDGGEVINMKKYIKPQSKAVDAGVILRSHV